MTNNTQTLTKFDTGELFEPQLHHDGSGRVDFDNDESTTELILAAKPYAEGDLDDTNVVEIKSASTTRLAVQVESGPLVVFNDEGTPTSLWGAPLDYSIPAPERGATRGAAIVALYDDEKTGVKDAVSDLMHFATSRGMDIEEVLESASFIHYNELREPLV